MRRVAILAAVFFMALLFAINSPKAHAAPIQTITQNSTNGTSAVPTAHTVTVHSGDTLNKLANRFGTTMLRLFYANKQIEDPNLIYPGEQLRIPGSKEHLTPRSIPGQIVAASSASGQTTSTDSGSAVPKVVTVVASPAPVQSPKTASALPTTTSNSTWDQLAMCESSGDWSIDTGNGFYGGLQFTLQSWQAVGGTGYPNDASPAEQIALAEKLLAIQGWNAWPACSLQLGLR